MGLLREGRQVTTKECMEAKIQQLIAKCDRLTSERDEARRMYCRMMSNNSRLEFATPQWFAEEEDWDCFKKEEIK